MATQESGMRDDEETVEQLFMMVRTVLCDKLAARLEAVRRDVGKFSGPGFTDLGVIVGFQDAEFVNHFGLDLNKVTDEDIWNLTHELPRQPSRTQALLRLYEHIEAASEGETGLGYFDEWTST